EKEAAILVKDKEAEGMIEVAIELLENKERKTALAENIKKLAKPNAASDIAAEVLKLIDNQA
ncbi:MAG: UDP-N-acetylglucosamine--N-acetylmuramyl-(pentapeptide) pyrophosphoryl-undecaprenol N-acetylglucosamine transferase, partial [Saprospiraceae bacterium]